MKEREGEVKKGEKERDRPKRVKKREIDQKE